MSLRSFIFATQIRRGVLAWNVSSKKTRQHKLPQYGTIPAKKDRLKRIEIQM